MRKWLPLFPLALALGLTAVAYGDLATEVRPAWDRLLPIDATAEPMARGAFSVLIPVLAIVVWTAFVLGARVRGRTPGVVPERLAAAAIERFEPTYHIIVFAVVSLLALMHVALLAAAAGWPSWTFEAVGAVLGIGLFLVGNLMPRVRPNWIVGVRTRATLTDLDLWTRTHRYLGGLLMLSGIVVIAVAIVATRYVFIASTVAVVISSALAHLLASLRTPSTVDANARIDDREHGGIDPATESSPGDRPSP